MNFGQESHVPTKPLDNKFVTFLLSHPNELVLKRITFGDGDFSVEIVSKKTSVSYELKIPYEKLAHEFEKDVGRPPVNGEDFVKYLREFKYETLKHVTKFTDEFYLIQLPDEEAIAEDMREVLGKKELD